jgi:hypothetical protein
MLKTIKEVGQSTPFLWWRESDDIDTAAILAVLTVSIGLILTARLRIEYQNVTSGALTAYLPSALGFSFCLCIASAAGLRFLPTVRLGPFIPLTARCLRLFCLCMLFVAFPFLAREVGLIPVSWAGLAKTGGKIPDAERLRFTFLYAGSGVIAFLLLVVLRGYVRLRPVCRRFPKRLDISVGQFAVPLLICSVVSGCAILSTYVALWAELPAWLALVKPG